MITLDSGTSFNDCCLNSSYGWLAKVCRLHLLQWVHVGCTHLLSFTQRRWTMTLGASFTKTVRILIIKSEIMFITLKCFCLSQSIRNKKKLFYYLKIKGRKESIEYCNYNAFSHYSKSVLSGIETSELQNDLNSSNRHCTVAYSLSNLQYDTPELQCWFLIFFKK